MINQIISIVFVCLITLPMLVSITQKDQIVSLSEKRTLNTWPKYQGLDKIKPFFSGATDYVQDHVGFREPLIHLNNLIKFKLNESPSKYVIKGSGDWLFYKSRDPLHISGIPNSEVIDALHKRAEFVGKRAIYLKSKKVAYLYMTAPNKMSLYSEYLPKIYGLTDVDASYKVFKKKIHQINADILYDTVNTLREHKSNPHGADLYYKNDTHWNPLGAYYAARGLVAQIEKQFPEIEVKVNEHSFKIKKQVGGDVAKMAGLEHQLYTDEPFTRLPSCSQRGNLNAVREGLNVSSCNVNKTIVLFIGDSFASALYPYLSESFGSIYLAGQGQGISQAELEKIIDEIKPDIMIEEIVQRKLTWKL